MAEENEYIKKNFPNVVASDLKIEAFETGYPERVSFFYVRADELERFLKDLNNRRFVMDKK